MAEKKNFMFSKAVYQPIIFLFLLTIPLISCAGGGASIKPDKDPLGPASPVIGVWKETFGVGQETDVTYNDVYEITYDNSTLIMINTGRPYYSASGFKLEDGRFRFTLVNHVYPDHPFTMEYDLVLSPDKKTMTGHALTSKGFNANILWERQE